MEERRGGKAAEHAPRRVAVFGATGLVGSALVDTLSRDPSVASVVAPVRRPVPRWQNVPGVETPLTPDVTDVGAIWAGVSQLFVCLGTTMKKAGSREAFRAVDLHAVRTVAAQAAEAGVRDVFLVTSAGAGPGARGFYLQVKSEAEQAVSALPFRSVHIFRPSILTGPRGESRPAERVGIAVAGLLAPLMRGGARRYRPIAGAAVARAMARVARTPGDGVRIYESEQIAALA